MDFHYYYITENWLTSTNLGPSFPKGRSISCFSWSALIDGNNYIHLSITQQQQKKRYSVQTASQLSPRLQTLFPNKKQEQEKKNTSAIWHFTDVWKLWHADLEPALRDLAPHILCNTLNFAYHLITFFFCL